MATDGAIQALAVEVDRGTARVFRQRSSKRRRSPGTGVKIRNVAGAACGWSPAGLAPRTAKVGEYGCRLRLLAAGAPPAAGGGFGLRIDTTGRYGADAPGVVRQELSIGGGVGLRRRIQGLAGLESGKTAGDLAPGASTCGGVDYRVQAASCRRGTRSRRDETDWQRRSNLRPVRGQGNVTAAQRDAARFGRRWAARPRPEPSFWAGRVCAGVDPAADDDGGACGWRLMARTERCIGLPTLGKGPPV